MEMRDKLFVLCQDFTNFMKQTNKQIIALKILLQIYVGNTGINWN